MRSLIQNESFVNFQTYVRPGAGIGPGSAADMIGQYVLVFPEDHAAPMPLDFYIWAIRGEGRTILLDTGFDRASGDRRGRQWLRSPLDALRSAGIDLQIDRPAGDGSEGAHPGGICPAPQ